MAYIRKTKNVWHVQGLYDSQYETVCEEDTYKAARVQYNCYRVNEPQYSHRIVMKRERLTELKYHA